MPLGHADDAASRAVAEDAAPRRGLAERQLELRVGAVPRSVMALPWKSTASW